MYSNFLDSMSLIINLFDLTLSLSASDSIINVMIFFPIQALKKVHSQIQSLQNKKSDQDQASLQQLYAEYKKIMATGKHVTVTTTTQQPHIVCRPMFSCIFQECQKSFYMCTHTRTHSHSPTLIWNEYIWKLDRGNLILFESVVE